MESTFSDPPCHQATIIVIVAVPHEAYIDPKAKYPFVCCNKMEVTQFKKHLNPYLLLGLQHVFGSCIWKYQNMICMRPWIRSLRNIWPKRSLRVDYKDRNVSEEYI